LSRKRERGLFVSDAGGDVTPPYEGTVVGTTLGASVKKTLSCVCRRGFLFQAVRLARRRSWALRATTMVLTDISAAPTAGESRMPIGARMPAASGSAKTLYPAAQIRFWIILR